MSLINPESKALFDALKPWLDKKPGDASIEKTIREHLLKPFAENQLNELRLFLGDLSSDDHKTLKKILFDHIKKLSKEYKMENNAAAPLRTIDCIQERYLAYKNSAQKEIDNSPLFEIFRIHKSGEMNRDTGTWKAFTEAMENGKFKNATEGKVSIWSSLFGGNAKEKELQSLLQPSNPSLRASSIT